MAPQEPYDPIPFAAENGLSLGERKDLDSQWLGTTEPPAIADFEAFETWTHQQITDALKGADTGGINSTATSWRGIYNTGNAALPDFAEKMQASIDEHWQGLSGQAAAAAVKEYTAQANQLLVSMLMVASDLDRTESVILETQTRVGAPPEITKGSNAALVEGAAEAEAEARRVMATFYQPGVAEVDSRTPRLPEPQPVAPPPMDGGAGQSGHGAGAGGSAADGGSEADGSSAASGGVTDGGGPSDAATRAASTTAQPSAGSGTGMSGAGTGSAVTGSTPQVSSAGGATTAGLVGGAAGALAAAPRMGGPLTSGAGGGAAAGVTPGTSGSARNAVPMGGMYPPMGRGRGEDDQNREPNAYLVAASNASELVGKLPMTITPVIGE